MKHSILFHVSHRHSFLQLTYSCAHQLRSPWDHRAQRHVRLEILRHSQFHSCWQRSRTLRLCHITFVKQQTHTPTHTYIHADIHIHLVLAVLGSLTPRSCHRCQWRTQTHAHTNIHTHTLCVGSSREVCACVSSHGSVATQHTQAHTNTHTHTHTQ